MAPLLPELPGSSRRWLLVIAAPKEWRAVAGAIAPRSSEPPGEWVRTELSARFDATLSGVGKANAAGATSRALDPSRHAGVISIGIAGALPGAGSGGAIGSCIAASHCVMGDEGVRTGEGLVPIASLGFPPTPEGQSIRCSPEIGASLAPIIQALGPIVTVSSCSGTDSGAAELAARTGAIAEAMEGAAVGVAARRVLGPDAVFGEVRVISNTTGDRARQRWDLALALETLAGVARAL